MDNRYMALVLPIRVDEKVHVIHPSDPSAVIEPSRVYYDPVNKVLVYEYNRNMDGIIIIVKKRNNNIEVYKVVNGTLKRLEGNVLQEVLPLLALLREKYSLFEQQVQLGKLKRVPEMIKERIQLLESLIR